MSVKPYCSAGIKKEDTSFREILLNVRLSQALSLMQNGESDLLTITLSCGYQSPERFSQQFTKIYGLTPKQYIKTI
ncbi:AraC family transcriptional regulator [Vibrio sp. PP-XX7]